MLDSPEAQFAIEAVREASLLARRVQREMVTGALTKDDRSPVTVADFAVQALVAQRLAERLPGSILVGEEQSAALQMQEGVDALEQVTQFVRTALPNATPEEVCGLIDRGRGEPSASKFWTLDPIDGTKGFLRREQYAVALGWICDGRVELGVLGCPELSVETTASGTAIVPKLGGSGRLLVAALGRGAFAQPLELAAGESRAAWQRLAVSKRSDPASARLMRSVEKAHTNTGEIGRLVTQLGITAPQIPIDSQAKYAMLAGGEGDILIRVLSASRPDYRENIWDHAGGAIVVTEAGGRVTDLAGRPLDFSQGRNLAKNRGVLATNGHLHEAVLAALRGMGV